MSGRRLPEGAVSELLAMVRDGLPYREIAEAFGVTGSVVTYHALRAGLTRRGPNALAAPRPSAGESPALGVDVPDWYEDALCAQTDPESFYPEKGGSTREAKKVCAACPVREACLEYALDNDERFGIWGGLSERERRKLKRDRRTPEQVEAANALRHRLRPEREAS